MPNQFTDLPEPWPLQPGEHPCPAAEAAAALLEIATVASDDAEAPLLSWAQPLCCAPQGYFLLVLAQRPR